MSFYGVEIQTFEVSLPRLLRLRQLPADSPGAFGALRRHQLWGPEGAAQGPGLARADKARLLPYPRRPVQSLACMRTPLEQQACVQVFGLPFWLL